MACVKKILVFSPSYRSCRMISLSACSFKRKPERARDPSKRNFQGEKLEEYMRKRAEAIEALQPYKNAVSDVIARFKLEVEEKERLKHDLQGEAMKREMAERQQALENLSVIAESNEELKRKRQLQKLIEEEEARKKEEEELRLENIEKERIRVENMELVLRVLEESKEFITPDNIDEKIDAVLENTVNFNYALTYQGNKIHSTKPPGNLDGFKGPSPTAYLAGGFNIKSTEFQTAFKDKDLIGFNLRRTYNRRLQNAENGLSEETESYSETKKTEIKKEIST